MKGGKTPASSADSKTLGLSLQRLLHDQDIAEAMHADLINYLFALLDGKQPLGDSAEILYRLARSKVDAAAPARLLYCVQALIDNPLPRASALRMLADLAGASLRQVDLDTATGMLNGQGLQNYLLTQMDEPNDGQARTPRLAAVSIHFSDPIHQLGQPGRMGEDELMRRVKLTLAGVLREGDEIASTGASTCVAVLPRLLHPALADLAAAKMANCLALLDRELRASGIHLDFAIGIATLPAHTSDPVNLLNFAHAAALRSRDSFALRARTAEWGDKDDPLTDHSFIQTYDPVLDGRPQDDGMLAAGLEQALRNSENQDTLKLFFQPQLDAESGKVLSMEALLRWEKDGTFLRPDRLLAGAERLWMRQQLSLWIIEAAIENLRRLSQHGSNASISVNLPANMLFEALPERIRMRLDIEKIAPERLCIEITEDVKIGDGAHMARVIKMLREIKNIGIHLAIDDFGSGHASLAWLRALPVDELKIDQLFVTQMLKSERDTAIVQSTIELAHAFGLEVVAEGIEDESTGQALLRMGCDKLQGYWFSRPLPFDQLLLFLEAHDGTRSGTTD